MVGSRSHAYLCGIAFLAAVSALRLRPPKVLALLTRTMHTSSQLPVSLSMLLLAFFVVLSEKFGFEHVLGAFAAGMVVGLTTRGEEGKPFREKIDGVIFGFCVPFFFVTSGIKFDLGGLLQNAKTMLLVPVFLTLFLIVRSAPVFLYRREPGKRRTTALCALFSGGTTDGARHYRNRGSERAHAL